MRLESEQKVCTHVNVELENSRSVPEEHDGLLQRFSYVNGKPENKIIYLVVLGPVYGRTYYGFPRD
jgi:hypothetical protein